MYRALTSVYFYAAARWQFSGHKGKYTSGLYEVNASYGTLLIPNLSLEEGVWSRLVDAITRYFIG